MSFNYSFDNKNRRKQTHRLIQPNAQSTKRNNKLTKLNLITKMSEIDYCNIIVGRLPKRLNGCHNIF